MTNQLDIFGKPPPAATPGQPRRRPVPQLLPPRPIAWERLLEDASCTDVTILVSTMWTSSVVETLSTPELGRKFLLRDGIIQDVTPDPGARGRVVFMTVAQAFALHARWPLVVVGSPGTHAATFQLSPTSDPVHSPTMAVLAQLEEV